MGPVSFQLLMGLLKSPLNPERFGYKQVGVRARSPFLMSENNINYAGRHTNEAVKAPEEQCITQGFSGTGEGTISPPLKSPKLQVPYAQMTAITQQDMPQTGTPKLQHIATTKRASTSSTSCRIGSTRFHTSDKIQQTQWGSGVVRQSSSGGGGGG